MTPSNTRHVWSVYAEAIDSHFELRTEAGISPDHAPRELVSEVGKTRVDGAVGRSGK